MTIAPGDAAVAARSFPRRWRALFAMAAGEEDEMAEDVLARSGAIELAEQAVASLTATAAALPALTVVRPPAGGDVLDRLEAAATALASAVDSVPADRWEGQPIDALTAGIDETAGLLRRAERAIEEARATR
jgi:hypothetical protein